MDEKQKRQIAQYLARNSRRRAKRDGIEHTIKWTDLQIPDTCPVTDDPFWPVLGQQTPTSVTIDRIDSELGYIPGNVWVISLAANKAKGDLSLEALKRIIAKLEEVN